MTARAPRARRSGVARWAEGREHLGQPRDVGADPREKAVEAALATLRRVRMKDGRLAANKRALRSAGDAYDRALRIHAGHHGLAFVRATGNVPEHFLTPDGTRVDEWRLHRWHEEQHQRS